MTSLSRIEHAPVPAFDPVWLARVESTVLLTGDHVQSCRLFDPVSQTHWFAQSAPLTATAVCERLRNAARLATRMESSWAAIPAATIWTPDRLVLISDAEASTQFGMVNASEREDVPIAARLELAIGAVRAVAAMHGRGLLQGVIRPESFLLDDDGRMRLTGFGYAVAVEEPCAALRHPADTVLPYLAPELMRQDGARPSVGADLYALGVTLYKLLTGELPFVADSPSGWQHAHMAIEPAPPQSRRPDLPAVLGQIVIKLMAKDAGSRYTSAAALLADLLRVRAEWLQRGRIEPFCLDMPGTLPLPGTGSGLHGRLSGRAREMEVLHGALARVRATGVSELVLLAGAAGVGKSALAEWLCGHADQTGARFAAGKSDQLQRDIPYAPVVQAITSLTMTLLGQDDASLQQVRLRWLDRLTGQGRAVAELAPVVEYVLGATVPLSEVPARQAQARIESAVLRTFAAFAAPGEPLLLFIDDLQWADASTLGLLEAFAAHRPANILLIAAYREPGHEMAQRLAWLQQGSRSGGLPVSSIALQSLPGRAVADLVATALDAPVAQVAPLARAIHARTGGNPLFCVQLLRALIDDGVLARGEAGWAWDDAALAHRRYSDNVIELMLRRFARLPKSGTALLQHLACVGIRGEAALQARVAGVGPDELAHGLRPFIDAGMIVEVPEGFAFQHDRVLEAAYSLVEPEARPAAHARVARVMIEHWGEHAADHAFEIGSQIERTAGQALSEPERVMFVRALNDSARRAKRAAVLTRAASHVDLAFTLMDATWWDTHYPLARDAHLLRCECLLAQADLDRAAREIDTLLQREMPAVDKAAVYRLLATLQTVRSDYEGAINAALSGLALVDVHLERHPSPARMREAYESVMALLGERSIDSLGELPVTADVRMHTVMGLLSTLISSQFVRDGISFLHVATMVELSLAHGATPETPYGLSWFGVFIASLYDAYEDGLAFGLAAMALVERHGYQAEQIATLVAVDQVSVWTRPLAFALGLAQEAVALGRESGDIGMACYACNHIVSDLLAMGEPLALVDEEIERGVGLTRLVRYADIERILAAQRLFLRSLRYGGDGPASTVAQRADDATSFSTRFWVWLHDGMAWAYRGQWMRALGSLRQAAALAWSAPAHINVADCRLYLALALAHAAPADVDSVDGVDGVEGLDRAGVLATLAGHRDRFARWTALNPLTFRNKLLLIDAEILRLQGDAMRALASYEQSARVAAASGFVHEQALACELAGALCLANGLPDSGLHHLHSARDAYRRWGAHHKADQLCRQYPELGDAGAGGPEQVPAEPARVAAGWELGMRAAQAMSSERVMDRLIESLMADVVVHAGAQYGLLLLMRGDRPMIEASARVVDGAVSTTLGTVEPNDDLLPLTVLNSVLRTRQTFALADASADAPSIRMRGASGRRLRSLLCLPLVRGGTLIGAYYLENNLAPGVFGAGRIAELEVLAPQVAIALETARLYEQLIDENDRRLAAEMGLRSARAELARTSHLTVMGTLAASIAHEVNQPLTAIVASVDASLRWLNRATPNLGEVQDGLAHIRKNGLRAAEIIRALRALARQTPSVMTPLQPDEVLSEVLDMVRMEIAGHGVRVSTSLSTGGALVAADRVQLQQVMLNLITNAIDAMATTPPDARDLVIASALENAEVVIRVEDAGHGIPDAMRQRLFDPFITSKQSGMGMGLAICKSIVEAHGGELDAAPRDGGGTVFTFRLPVLGSATRP